MNSTSETVLALLREQDWTPTSNNLMLMLKLIDEHHFAGYFFGNCGRFAGTHATEFATGWRGRMTATAARMEPRGGRYFIVFSSIIFGNLARMFREDQDATTTANGRTVKSLVAAYQVIAEHEMAHLYLYMKNGDEAHGPAFRKLVAEKFGHTAWTHSFPAARSQLAAKNVRINTVVKFEYKGRRVIGRVANVRKTATVVRGANRWNVPVDRLVRLTDEEKKEHGPLPAETRIMRVDPVIAKFIHLK